MYDLRKKIIIRIWLVIGVLVAIIITVVTLGVVVANDKNSAVNNSNTPGQVGQNVIIEGTYTCLSRKDAGPHTMECALGLRTSGGAYYSLGSTDPALMMGIATGERIRVEGSLGAPISTYDTAGSITVKRIIRL